MFICLKLSCSSVKLAQLYFLPFSYILRGKSPYTLKHGKPDHEATDVWK